MAETRRVFPQSPSAPILEETKRKDGEYLSSSQRRKQAAVFPQEPPYERRRRRRGCLGCCCYLLGWLIFVLVCIVVALGIAALVVWLVLRPIHLPNYSVEQVSLSSISTNSAPPTVSATIDYRVRAHNPNKHIGIHYDSIRVLSDYNGNLRVGVGELPGFYQPHRNVTILHGTVVADRVGVSQSLVNSIQSDVAQGRVPLTIVVRVRARVKARSLTLPKIRVRYTCHIHVSPANSPGGARLLDKRCKVRVGL